MNERIQSLAEEAGYNPEDGGVFKFDDFKLEKFSELLIRECIEVIRKTERTPPGFFYAKGADILEVEIYKHFGVEE